MVQLPEANDFTFHYDAAAQSLEINRSTTEKPIALQLMMVDVAGKIWLHQSISTFPFTTSVEALPTGVYVASLQSGGKVLQAKKMVK